MILFWRVGGVGVRIITSYPFFLSCPISFVEEQMRQTGPFFMKILIFFYRSNFIKAQSNPFYP